MQLSKIEGESDILDGGGPRTNFEGLKAGAMETYGIRVTYVGVKSWP